jgi:hypothetical protein
LPAALTTFISRDLQLARLAAQFHRNRLLALVGPGDVDKRVPPPATLGTTPMGLWLVDLAQLTPGSEVRPAIAAVLRKPERASATLAQQYRQDIRFSSRRSRLPLVSMISFTRLL